MCGNVCKKRTVPGQNGHCKVLKSHFKVWISKAGEGGSVNKFFKSEPFSGIRRILILQ